MRFLTKKQVRELSTLSYAEQARKRKAGRFPELERLSDHPTRGRVAYREADYLEWAKDPRGYRWKPADDAPNRSEGAE